MNKNLAHCPDLRLKANSFIAVCCVLIGVSFANADSLWNKDSSSPYSPEKAYKIGDIITIIVDENTSAQQKAGTNTTTKDDLGAQLTHTIARLNPLISANTSITSSNGNKYTGQGSTQRASTVTTKIAAMVTEVLDNGNIKIDGSHYLDVNDESQQILVSGIVRSKDISVANSVYSYQVANAQISVKGTGAVQEAESPGWFTRILNWLF